MKKFLLSGFVLISFVVYSLYQRGQFKDETSVVTPQNLNNNQSTSEQTLPTATPILSSPPTPSPTSTPTSIPTNTPVPTPQSIPTNTPTPTSGYKDGTYTGNVTDATYGNVQVQTTITNGRITDVQFLQYPNDRRTSVEINSQAMPYLKQEAIQAQSAQVDIVSGATYTSQAFIQSLQSTLDKAKG